MTQNDAQTTESAYWLKIAQKAIATLPAYKGAEVAWLAHTHNAVFLVEKADEKAVLYLYKHGIDFDMLLSEWEWLRAISFGTQLTVSQYLSTVQVIDDETGQIIQGAVRQYIPGQPIPPDELTPDHMRAIGHFLAELHDFSERYTPPANFIRPQLDYEGLFGRSGIYHPGEGAEVFTEAQNTIMQAVTKRVKAAMAALGKSSTEFGLIHGDMLSKNVLFHDGSVRAIDFEYSGWGYYLYDLTPLLWQLKSQVNYAVLSDALWAGYGAIRPLTEQHETLLETFIAARQVASMRWLASNLDHPMVKDTAEQLIAQRTDELEGFLQNGILKRHSITL